MGAWPQLVWLGPQQGGTAIAGATTHTTSSDTATTSRIRLKSVIVTPGRQTYRTKHKLGRFRAAIWPANPAPARQTSLFYNATLLDVSRPSLAFGRPKMTASAEVVAKPAASHERGCAAACRKGAALILLAISAVIFSTIGLLVSLLGPRYSSWQITSCRFYSQAVCVWIGLVATRTPIAVPRNKWLPMFLRGFCGSTAMMLFYFAITYGACVVNRPPLQLMLATSQAHAPGGC